MNRYEIIGQKFVIERCLAIVEKDQFNILLRGWWGTGKTTLAKRLPAMTYFLSSKTFQIAPIKPEFDPAYHEADVHIIDEAHRIKDFERLYGWMEEYNFIFTSNMTSKIPEPFLSRCFVFRLQNYSEGEIAQIVMEHTGLDEASAFLVAKRSRKIPRTAVRLAQKAEMVLEKRGDQVTPDTISGLMDELGIDERGLTPLDKDYLEILQTGPRSSRELRAMLSIDPDELERMERYLLRLGEISITNKGRELV